MVRTQTSCVGRLTPPMMLPTAVTAGAHPASRRDQRNVRTHRTSPTTSQTTSTSAVGPCCHEPGHLARLQLRRQEHRAHALRHPLQREHRGDAAASTSGSSLKTKNTPEMNCSTITTGVTTAVALRPERGHRRERDAQHRAGRRAEERRSSANVAHACGVGRQVDVEDDRGDGQQERGLREAGHQDQPDLAEEVGQRRHRRAAQPLERAVVALDRDGDGERLEARQHDAGGHHARQEVLRERHTRSAVTGERRVVVAAEHRGEDRQHDHREGEDEDDRVLLAEELDSIERSSRRGCRRPAPTARTSGAIGSSSTARLDRTGRRPPASAAAPAGPAPRRGRERAPPAR